MFLNYEIFDVLNGIESNSSTISSTTLMIGKDEQKASQDDDAVLLQSGHKMPRVGFGTAALGVHTKRAVVDALDLGYRMIDSAQAKEWYREDLVGEALVESGVARADVFVTSKLHPRDMGRKGVEGLVKRSLVDLRTEYVDLFLLHYSECWGSLCANGEPVVEGTWKEAWRELEKLVDLGVLRNIGVSNFDRANLEELHEFARIQPAVVQERSDLYATNSQAMEICKKYGWQFEAYSSLGGQWWMYKKNPVLHNEVVDKIVLRLNKDLTAKMILENKVVTPAMVVLNYAKNVLKQVIIPRSANKKHMEESLRVDEFTLTDEECESLRKLDGSLQIKQ